MAKLSVLIFPLKFLSLVTAVVDVFIVFKAVNSSLALATLFTLLTNHELPQALGFCKTLFFAGPKRKYLVLSMLRTPMSLKSVLPDRNPLITSTVSPNMHESYKS